jgi:hypothetical protein
VGLNVYDYFVSTNDSSPVLISNAGFVQVSLALGLLPLQPALYTSNSSCTSCRVRACVRAYTVLHDLQHGKHEPTIMELPQHVWSLSSEPESKQLFMFSCTLESFFLLVLGRSRRALREKARDQGFYRWSITGPRATTSVLLALGPKREKNKEKIGKGRVPFSQDVSVAVISLHPYHNVDVAANPRGTSPFTLYHQDVSAL